MKTHKSYITHLVLCLLFSCFRLHAGDPGAGAGTSCASISGTNDLAVGDDCICPSGTGRINDETVIANIGISAAAGALALCTDLLPGFFLDQQNTKPALCSPGFICKGLQNAFTLISCTTNVDDSCVGSDQQNQNAGESISFTTDGNVNPQDPNAGGTASCPAGSYCPTAGLSTPTQCPAGSKCTGTGLTASTACAAGQFSAAGATACTSCPAFATSTAPGTSIAGCTDLKAGYAFTASGSAQQASAVPTACPAGSFCPGKTNVFVNPTPTITGLTAAAGNMVLFSASALTGGFTLLPTATLLLPQACPAGTTNALTAGNNVGVFANDATVCDDLAPGYTILANIAASGSTAVTISGSALLTGITPCAAGSYCLGKSGLINILTMPTSTTFTYAAITAPSGANSGAPTTCPTGSSSAASSTATAACTQLAAGYYILATAASGSAPTACPAGSYCAGATTATPALASGVLSAASSAIFGATACPSGFSSPVSSTVVSACNVKCDISTPAGCTGDYLFSTNGTQTIGCYYGNVASGLGGSNAWVPATSGTASPGASVCTDCAVGLISPGWTGPTSNSTCLNTTLAVVSALCVNGSSNAVTVSFSGGEAQMYEAPTAEDIQDANDEVLTNVLFAGSAASGTCTANQTANGNFSCTGFTADIGYECAATSVPQQMQCLWQVSPPRRQRTRVSRAAP
jgi:hypothetical protein